MDINDGSINNSTDAKANNVLYQDVLPGGAHWSMLMRRGTQLTLIDQNGGANVGMMMFNPADKLERYNAPDTLKCQHTFKLTQGHCLYSDMGRIFCSVVEDSVGWHDTVGGFLSDELLKEKYQVKSYQDSRNDWTLSAEHAFSVELAKYELGQRDYAANLNLFSALVVDEQGNMSFREDNSKAGDLIRLRFEMDTLVVLNTCPHPMDPSSEYPKRAVAYQIALADSIAEDDECMNSCEENKRGFENNRLYHIGLPTMNMGGMA
jgi:urea carboxylase-associated protein 2